jgi:hypothetical protein
LSQPTKSNEGVTFDVEKMLLLNPEVLTLGTNICPVGMTGFWGFAHCPAFEETREHNFLKLDMFPSAGNESVP